MKSQIDLHIAGIDEELTSLRTELGAAERTMTSIRAKIRAAERRRATLEFVRDCEDSSWMFELYAAEAAADE